MFECKNINSFISISQLFKVIKYFKIENDMCVNVDLLDNLNVYIQCKQIVSMRSIIILGTFFIIKKNHKTYFI